MKRLRSLLAVMAIAIILLSGCGGPTDSIETTAQTVAGLEETSASLLAQVELTLPDFLSRQSASGTCDYFYQDGEIVGGIAALDIADQMDTMDVQAYVEEALAVTKAVYDTHYDYMGSNESICQALVSVADQSGREFYHYFFKGSQMGYDVWIDNAVLDTRDMRSYLKTLHAEDLYNPQDDGAGEDEIPLLNLRMTLPEGVQWQPTQTTRGLYYMGETLVGGVEQIAPSTDLDVMGQAAAALAEELCGGEFTYTEGETQTEGNLTALLRTDSEDAHVVHYILTVGEECYDVWADTAHLPEADALAIARSCQY